MKAGSLHHAVLIEDYPVNADGTPITRGASGGITPHDWRPFVTVRAEITPLGGQERIGASTFNPESTHRIIIRYYPGITTLMRMTDVCGALCPFNGKPFDIVSLNFENVGGSNIREIDFEVREGRSHGNV